MSEYQYSRFERLDGCLDNTERHALSNTSSRAELTANSFQVYYNYSSLRADPSELVLNYFDVGLYYADWGSIDVYIKLPAGTVPDEVLQIEASSLYIQETNQWQLLVFSIEEYYEYFDNEYADDFFYNLAELRSELMQGDWRLFYFIWLSEVEFKYELTSLPLINFDFNHLSKAQLAFADLFDIPLALVKALALALVKNPHHQASQEKFQIDDWLNNLTMQEKDKLLRIVFEQGQLTSYQALAEIKKGETNKKDAYQHWLKPETIKPYTKQAEMLFEQEQAAAEAQRRAIEKEEKETALSETYSNRESVWLLVQEQASRRCASGYDRASRELHLLDEAYSFKGSPVAFEQRLREFLLRNSHRNALLNRLKDLCAKYGHRID